MLKLFFLILDFAENENKITWILRSGYKIVWRQSDFSMYLYIYTYIYYVMHAFNILQVVIVVFIFIFSLILSVNSDDKDDKDVPISCNYDFINIVS